MRILINCPIPPEFKACVRNLDLHERVRNRLKKMNSGTIGGVNVLALQSGAGRDRAAEAVEKAAVHLRPDLVLDTGSCAALNEEILIGTIILATRCLEVDKDYSKISRGKIEKREVTAGLWGNGSEVPCEGLKLVEQTLRTSGFSTVRGAQGCGTFMLSSVERRRSLYLSLGALGWNWETSGVFDSACRMGIPGLSLRIVTDMGDERALSDFVGNIKPESKRLYQAIRRLIENGRFRFLLSGQKRG